MRSKMRAARADSHACVRLFAGRDASESDGHEEHDEAMVRERARGESRDDLAAAAARGVRRHSPSQPRAVGTFASLRALCV